MEMKKVLALIVCFIFAGVGSIFAEAELQKLTWELGTEISQIKYKQPGRPGTMKEEGMMYGVVGSFTYHDKVMFKGEGKGSWGQVKYDGILATIGTYSTLAGIKNYIYEFRGLGGYDFPILTTTILTPYIGFGYRYLNDDFELSPFGYEKELNYFYSPVGIEVITSLEDGWSIGVTAEYDFFWSGRQISHFSDFDPLFGDVENELKEGYGIRGSVKVQKKTKIGTLIL